MNGPFVSPADRSGGDNMALTAEPHIYSRKWSEPKALNSEVRYEYITRITKSPTLYEDTMEAGFHKFSGAHAHINDTHQAYESEEECKPGMYFSGFTIPIYTNTRSGMSNQERYLRGVAGDKLCGDLARETLNQENQRGLSSYRDEDGGKYSRYAHFLVHNINGSFVLHDRRCAKTNCLGWIVYDPKDEDVKDGSTTRNGKFKCNPERDLWSDDYLDDRHIEDILSQEPLVERDRTAMIKMRVSAYKDQSTFTDPTWIPWEERSWKM